MINKITWADKYALALQEELTVNEIMLLRSIGQHRALKIRKEAIDYCLKNNIEISAKRIPTEAILIVTNLDISYYYNKMLQEAEMLKMKSLGACYVSA